MPKGERHLPAQTSWSPPPPLTAEREGLAELGNVRLWFQDTGGSGDVVVLIHAWTGSYATWAYQQSVFAAAGYRVISYSARGHYRSSPIDPADPGTSTADLRALLDHLEVGRAHLVSTAGGALPALDFALSHPDRTISLTCASGHMGITDPDYAGIGARTWPRGVKLPAAFREVGPSYRVANQEGLAAWNALEEVGWQGGEVRQTTETPNTFARVAAELRVPTLIITGDADLVMPPSRVRMVAPYMPDAEIVIVAEAGHSLHWEQPEAFNATVLDFMRRNGDSAEDAYR